MATTIDQTKLISHLQQVEQSAKEKRRKRKLRVSDEVYSLTYFGVCCGVK